MLLHALQHVAERDALLGCQLVQQVLADRGNSQGPDRRRIGLDDLEIGGADQQHGVVGGIEQKSIAGLDLAQLPIVAFHRLLRRDQPRLQLGHRMQVPADRQES